MLANLVDIDEAMAMSACSSEDGGAMFYDFAAAFPSVEHDFMMEVFRAMDWPAWLLNFVSVLYANLRCQIVLGGSRHCGFAISRGIRQGCPLSPLLFAVAEDLLLRRLVQQIPDGTLRAYADDTAFVHPSIWKVSGRPASHLPRI